MNQAWISGIIQKGDGRGRKLGFPTANLNLPFSDRELSAGIYAVWARIDGGFTSPGVLHVGPRPTFANMSPTVELHLLNTTDQDLYDRQASFYPVKRIRGVKKFDSAQELIHAMKQDCIKASAILRASPKPGS